MKDRIPKDPGRVLITPENGSAPFYATMTRADNPEQEGTPLNKNSLLKDETAALFGLGTDALPDDVLAAIKSVIDTKAKIAIGSYAGAGTEKAKTLTFDFTPQFIYIASDESSTMGESTGASLGYAPIISTRGVTKGNQGGGYSYSSYTVAWGEKSVTITPNPGNAYNSISPGSYNRFNYSGKTYHYIAIG